MRQSQRKRRNKKYDDVESALWSSLMYSSVTGSMRGLWFPRLSCGVLRQQTTGRSACSRRLSAVYLARRWETGNKTSLVSARELRDDRYLLLRVKILYINTRSTSTHYIWGYFVTAVRQISMPGSLVLELSCQKVKSLDTSSGSRELERDSKNIYCYVFFDMAISFLSFLLIQTDVQSLLIKNNLLLSLVIYNG